MDMRAEFERCRILVDNELETMFREPCPQRTLLEAMRYSLLAGGKRIRPVLVLKFCQAAGGDMQKAMPFACAIELMHTYSLVHDDLPCMDNDALRRGKATNHVVFGECAATLAGDALQTAAFELLLSHETVMSMGGGKACVRAAHILASAAGCRGMAGGQILDMQAESKPELTEAELMAIHERKTGALIKAACQMGVLAADGEIQGGMLDAAGEYARQLGLAFQIRDDMLDVTSTTEALGKPVGSDEASGKTTFATLLGVDECQKRVETCTEGAKAALKGKFEDSSFLDWLADALAVRKK